MTKSTAGQTTPAARPRPPAWALRNWRVRSKVLLIALLPLVLAGVFGGLGVQREFAELRALQLTAARAAIVPAITDYQAAFDAALLANSTDRGSAAAGKRLSAAREAVQSRIDETDVTPEVRSAVGSLINGGEALMDQIAADTIGVRERVIADAPLLLTAEKAITASLPVVDDSDRSIAGALSRAVVLRGQMTLQEILLIRGADLPAPQLRSAMAAVAGSESAPVFAVSALLGAGSAEAATLQQEMVARTVVIADPDSALVANSALRRSISVTDQIATTVIRDTSAAVQVSIGNAVAAQRQVVIRDAAVVLAAIAGALIVMVLVARSLITPLRVLRDGALKIAHTDLGREVAEVRAGAWTPPEPLPLHTTEEIGQVAHAVDELHAQALALASGESRLRMAFNDMFTTMSRRNRSLVDQQISLIDTLESDEQEPQRLDALFRLDHLAARLRRNSANLLVLAGAPVSRDQRHPLALATAIRAALSEVDDYRRVEVAAVPDVVVAGAAVGEVTHILAELMDNALRYSAPTTTVGVSGDRASAGGIVVWIADSGLGLTDADRRMANMRLQVGDDVALEEVPDNARHMGLFVIGRLARRHGIRVVLHGSSADGDAQGTTAEVYLPPGALHSRHDRASGPGPEVPKTDEVPTSAVPTPASAPTELLARVDDSLSNFQVSLLSQRSSGADGVADIPAPRARGPVKRELPTPWWQTEDPQDAPPASGTVEPAPAPTDTSAFFARRSAVAAEPPTIPAPSVKAAQHTAQPGDPAADAIYRRMLAEMMGDPHDLANSPDLDWQTVWDRGWSLAAEAESAPVDTVTAHGLPRRTPGARLIPGAASHEKPEASRDEAESS